MFAPDNKRERNVGSTPVAENQPEPIRRRPNDHDRPIGYWVIKGLAILGIVGLAGFQLTTEQQVSPIVFALLATLAGGPEVADWLRK